MTALVAQPVSAIADALSKVGISRGYTGQKQKLDVEEKRKRIFETSYEPSLEWWTSNQASYVKPAGDPLPAGFPEKDESASNWDGKELITTPERWLYTFTESDIAQINQAYDHWKALGLPKNEITRDTFPLPAGSALVKALTAASEEVKHGLGLKVLRGLPVDEWDREKQIAVFAGISAYIADKRIRQGLQNIVHLRDITNLDADKRPVITVKGQTSGNQVFHNDGTVGIIGLITLGVAETGGLSQLASVARTYNEFATKRRDILRELVKDDWKNKANPDGVPLLFPVTNRGKTQVISSYSRRPYFGFYEADPDVPALSKEKHLALDAVHFTAEKFSLDLDLQKGDLEYFNNLTVYHARTASEDSETNARHLLRVHLTNDDQPRPEIIVKAVQDRLDEGPAPQWPEEAWESVDGTGGK